MNFNEAMQMLGTKLQGKYGHLGFKYKKSDKTLTRHSKKFTYMIAFSSFQRKHKGEHKHRGLLYNQHPSIRPLWLCQTRHQHTTTVLQFKRQ